MKKRINIISLIIELLAIALVILGGHISCTQPPSKQNSPAKAPPSSEKPVQPYSWKVELMVPQKQGIITKSSFRDDFISISFEVLPNLISLQYKNISLDEIYIAWNDSYFEFPDNQLSKIIHGGVAYEHRNHPLLNDYIFPGKNHAIFIAPKSRVDWNHLTGKWRSFPMIEGPMENLPGQHFSFNLILHSKGKIMHYPFTFEIKRTMPITLERLGDRIVQQPFLEEEMIKRLSADTLLADTLAFDSLQNDTAYIDTSSTPESKISTSLPVKQDTSTEEGYLDLSPDEENLPEDPNPARPQEAAISSSQSGINSLLEKMEKEKSDWEKSQREAEALEKALRDSLENARQKLLKADSLKAQREEQQYFDTLSTPENIPLFDDEQAKVKNTKSKPDKSLPPQPVGPVKGIGGL